MIRNYLSLWVETVMELFYTPEEVCSTFDFCPPFEKNIDHSQNEIPPLEPETEVSTEVSTTTTVAPPVNNKPFCVICEFAMTIVEKQV